MYVRIGMCSIRISYEQLFGAYPEYAHKNKELLKQTCKLLQIKQQHKYRD
jgi:hypothetical protein